MVVRHLVEDEEIFLANSEGLTDPPLDEMIGRFKRSGKIDCFIAIHPPISFRLAEFDEKGSVRQLRSSQQSDIWNGGYFIFRNKIFDLIQDVTSWCFNPSSVLIAERRLMAYKDEGFWRVMYTLRDRQVLEDMVERGEMPWRLSSKTRTAAVP